MKRADLVRHLLAHGCRPSRAGARHSVFVNADAGLAASIPRHREIDDYLAKKICRDPEVPEP